MGFLVVAVFEGITVTKRLDGFGECPPVFTVQTNGFMAQWCCGCDLRHMWHFRVVRNRRPKDDEIEISLLCDDTATKLLRSYKRRKKK